MRRAEITRKFDEIVSFAGTEAFLDTPVKHYSSGMYMRLAFAVAAHLDPEILIVDEVLAVGDAAFQKKCLGKMGDVAKQGRTVLFVSHNLGAVRSLCTRGIVLAAGAMQFDGAVDEAIARYLSSAADRGEQDGQVSFGSGGLAFDELAVLSVRLRNEAGEVRALFDAMEPITIDIEYQVTAPAARRADGDRARDVGRRGGVSVHRSADAGRRSAARPLPDVVHDPGGVAEWTDVRGGDRLRHPERQDARPDAPLPFVRRGGRDRSRRGLVAGHREPAAPLGDAPRLSARRASARAGQSRAHPGPIVVFVGHARLVQRCVALLQVGEDRHRRRGTPC